MARIKTSETLGEQVRDHLISIGLESEESKQPKSWGTAALAMKQGTLNFLSALNQLPDPSRDDTPYRVADMYIEDLCWGLDYSKFPKCTATPNDMKYDQMVRVTNIQVCSLCEHHFQAIYGSAHIAYIPKDKVLGLSKFARVVEFFSRRPQIQERLTEQVAACLKLILETDDVAVVVDAEHFCMKVRGVMQHSAVTRTDKMSGRFLSNPSLRAELLQGLK